MPNQHEHELVQLQEELAAEIGRDAPHIATMVFGETKNHPDVASVSNQQLDEVYRQKFQSEDRAWLQAEARRDPEQFLNVSKRIGAQIPPPQPPAPAPPVPLPAPPPVAQAPMLPPAPPVPIVPPAAAVPPRPVVVPSSPVAPVQAPAPPPVILGPNGMPLPSTRM